MLAASSVAFAEDGPFVSSSLKEACAKAAKEHKVVFIDFYTTWCGPCKVLDQTTWKDPKVVSWLSEKTVALRLDAEKEVSLARRYQVDGYPTLLFLKPDGTEIDRTTGVQSPSEFLEMGNAVLAGKDAITRAKEKLEASGKDDPMARMEYARTLCQKGKHEEALKEYLWCFDEGLKHGPAFFGVRLSFLLQDIADLGSSYPPALDALRQRRDAAEQAIVSGKASLVRVLEFTSINQYLGVPQASLAMYDRLRQEQPKSDVVGLLRDNLMDELLAQHRYAEIAEGTDLNAKIDQRFAMFNPNWVSKLFMMKYSKEERQQIEDAQSESLVQHVGQYYQILIGLKRLEEADKLAQRLLAVNGGAQTYNALAWNGYLTGAPVEANVTQARKAYEMTQGNDAAIVDTLARILDARGQRREAISIVREAGQRVTDPAGQEVLDECLRDLGGSPAVGRWSYPLTIAIVLVLLLVLILMRRRRRGEERLAHSKCSCDPSAAASPDEHAERTE